MATSSSDCSARIYDVKADFMELAVMKGHREEVSKVKNKLKPLLKRNRVRSIGQSRVNSIDYFLSFDLPIARYDVTPMQTINYFLFCVHDIALCIIIVVQ